MSSRSVVWFSLMMAFAVFAYCGMASAANTAPAAAAKDVKASITGMVHLKTEKVNGQDVKHVELTVTSAKNDTGAAIPALAGKMLQVTGPKAADVEKLAGKSIEVKGIVKDNKTIEVESVIEKPAPAK